MSPVPGLPIAPCIPVGPDGPVVTQSSSVVFPVQPSIPRLMPTILPLLLLMQISIFSAADTWKCGHAEYRSGGRTDQPTPRKFKRTRHVHALHFLFPSTRDDFRSRFHLSSPPRVPESEGARGGDRVVHRPPHVHGVGRNCSLGSVGLDRECISRQEVQTRGNIPGLVEDEQTVVSVAGNESFPTVQNGFVVMSQSASLHTMKV